MSRTIRRKNFKISEWVDKNKKWKFYSDSGVGDFYFKNSPKNFKKKLNKIKRKKNKMETKRIYKERDFFNYNYIPIKRDASYLWW